MYKNDAKITSKWCMGCPEGRRRGTGRVKDTSGVVLDEFWSFLEVDFGIKNELFPECFFGCFLSLNLAST